MSYRTRDVADMLGITYTQGHEPQRLFPHTVRKYGLGNPAAWTRHDATAALVWHALNKHHDYRAVSCAVAIVANDNPTPWVLCWPTGWVVIRHPSHIPMAMHSVPVGVIPTLLFLDNITRPLRPHT